MGRERNYLLLEPKVIVEPLIFATTDLEDFKFFCWRGEPRMVRPTPRPETLLEMLAVARALRAPFSLVRVDLYTDNKQVLVGEITNCSANAGEFFLPRSAERKASQLMFG